MIVFESEAEGEQFQPMAPKNAGQEISGEWELQLNHMNGEKHQIKINSLYDLIESKESKEFAGEAIYEKKIKINSDKIQYIDLGDVHGISELTLNGKFIGTKWYGSHIYNVDGVMIKGENKLSVKLTTIVGNYLKGLKDNPVAMTWTRRQPYYSMGMIGPVKVF
jgi:hypothetical protein